MVVLRPGDVIAGKYRVLHEIGRGGMGVVVAADHLLLPQQVAIKLLKRDADAVSLARFEREAHVVVQLRSEHVCRVLDVGALDDGAPFIVMELLQGCDLATWVEREGPLPVSHAVDYLLQACEALAEAHVRGVVHRDLKPSNLFLTEGVDGSPLVKVLDFGISKARAPEGSRGGLTESGAILGSPRFMAPEQLMSQRTIDHRTDIWALGVLFRELVTGRAAFEGDTAPELFVAILQQELPPMREVAPHVPEALGEVIARCTRKRSDDRYTNVGALALALAPFAPPAARPLVDRIVRTLTLHGWAVDVGAEPTVVRAEPSAEPVDDSAATVAASNDAPVAAIRATSTERPTAPAGGSSRGIWLGLGIGVLLTLAVGTIATTIARNESTSVSAPESETAIVEPTAAPVVSAPSPATCYFELCDPTVTVAVGAPVEALALLPAAEKRAKQLEAESELVLISTTPMVDGAFVKDSPGSIHYAFRYPKPDGSHAVVQIGIGPSMLFARHGPDIGATPIAAPKCSLQDALASAYAAGLSRTVETVAIWGSHGPKWMLSQSSPARAIAIDDGCRETTLLP